MAVPTFVDRVVLHVSGGRGGSGVASVHRETSRLVGLTAATVVMAAT